MIRRSLVVIAKQPLPGQVKTRIATSIGIERAAILYQCALEDTIEMVAGCNSYEPLLSYAPDTAQARRFFSALAAGFKLIPQRGKDFGERLLNIFRQVAQNDVGSAVLIGTDSPSLPPSYLDQAFTVLDDPKVDVVLGPAMDGGYYLIGMRQPLPILFERIHWSTNLVAAETMSRAVEANLRLECLPTWYDIDTVEDLKLLLNDRSCHEYGRAQRTRSFLRGIELHINNSVNQQHK
jgi:hypothetical protein